MSKGNRFASYSVMTALARAAPPNNGLYKTRARRNAYFRVGRGLPTVSSPLPLSPSLSLSLSISVSFPPE